ncbi:cyclic nucleotide-binding domain-containing protein [Kosmotoga pacifica]|uniref:Cyclic nucleotide-binding domain-containing protein n=1 Tax=Kosmotoga pacifica TaxID=1330330 RepID=A0A0G2Z5T1_9BACT|nr:cyclic nucleotide-binding domain-containing protein [Kosmotoga pacifica]AKI96940.1 hypothetical protein IX53_02885 [Kosmotoga pacifica]
MKEVKFNPDEKIARQGQEVSCAYIIQSGGAILKHNGSDRIFIAGDIIDPVSVVSGKSTGDVYSVGSTSLICGTVEEILEFIKKHPKLLQRALIKAVEELSYFDDELRDRLQSIEDITAVLVSKRQFLLSSYPPLLFGEKPLYRKAVKQLQKKDFEGAIQNLKCYLKQYQNSPLSRPVKLYLALGELNVSNYDNAAELLISLLNGSKDLVSNYVRKLFSAFELNETAFILTKGTPTYPEGFFEKVVNENSENIIKINDDMPLVEEGATINNIYFILEGNFWITKKHGNKFFKLIDMPPGSTFGELHILTNSKSDSTLMARTGSKVIVIDKKSFFKTVIFELPDAGVELLKHLLSYERELLNKD